MKFFAGCVVVFLCYLSSANSVGSGLLPHGQDATSLRGRMRKRPQKKETEVQTPEQKFHAHLTEVLKAIQRFNFDFRETQPTN